MILNRWYCSGAPHCSNEDPVCCVLVPQTCEDSEREWRPDAASSSSGHSHVGATPSWQIRAPPPRTRAPPVRSRRPQRGGCRTSLDLFHVVQLFSYLKEYYSVVWWNNNWKNIFLVFFSQSSNRAFSQSHWFSFLKALKYITMKEPGLINLQPYYCIITCYLNCCSKLHYCIMPMKENKLQGTKYSVVR